MFSLLVCLENPKAPKLMEIWPIFQIFQENSKFQISNSKFQKIPPPYSILNINTSSHAKFQLSRTKIKKPTHPFYPKQLALYICFTVLVMAKKLLL